VKLARKNAAIESKWRQNKRASVATKRLKKRTPRLYKFPESGKPFKREHLTPIAKKFYKRLSQIYGIPLSDLLPKMAVNQPLMVDFFAKGYYNPSAHEIGLHSAFYVLLKGRAPKGVLEEELLHSAQHLLTEAEFTRFKRKYLQKMEKEKRMEKEGMHSLRSVRHRPFIEATAKMGESLPKAAYNTLAIPLLTYAILGAHPAVAISLSASWASLRAYRRFISRGYYKRHGTDGFIVLFTDPPKKWRLSNLSAKEKEFIEKGYLSKRGGLTKMGIGFIRRRIPRQVLLENARFLRGERATK